ncbi:MAG TPA: GNAT family N-acetyltransferase [Candidatus Limnocylindrales bacterium]|nr:GNAT family N-acetyltransferase [Candidatus Limnocylindrales bacterium]
MSDEARVELLPSLDGVDAAEWNALVGPDDPFLEYEFLHALETSGVVGQCTTWQPRHLTVWDGKRLIGAMPLYVRNDSYGEYIFDFGWAEAYARAGMRYYPKAVASVPFTPVTGSRLLVAPDRSFDAVAAVMVDALPRAAEALELSGVHVLFPRRHEHDFLVSRGFLSRITHQYHWFNRGYRTFDDYLADLRSKKRKQVLRERAEVAEQGLKVTLIEGDAVTPEHVAAVWRFYLGTAERKWSQPYLVRETFETLATTFRKNLVLVLAHDGRRYVGGTFNVRGRNALFGRYWGTIGHYPSLHFECCYWQLIEYAIERGIELVEAGAQGEHKFLRGFVARPTYSAHWMAHPGGFRAIANFLEHEREYEGEVIERYNRVSPVKSERSK